MKNRLTQKLKLAALATIGFHFLTVVLHSVAHEILSVKASAAQLAFIIPVIIFAPIVAGFILPKRKELGAVLLIISMLGSFLLGFYYHLIAETHDHVRHVADLQPALWAAIFGVTAYLLLVLEFIGAISGLLILNLSQSLRNYAARTSF